MFSTLGILTAGVIVCLCIALFMYIQKVSGQIVLATLAVATVLFTHMIKISEKQEQQNCSQIQQVQTK